MTIEVLRKAMVDAMKAGQKERKTAISSLISAVKKVAIDNECREEIPEELVNSVIQKELKTVKEQISTCPAERTDMLEKYQLVYDTINEFAPKLLSEDEIRAILTTEYAEVIASKNKGLIMKTVSAAFKGKADMKLVNEIVSTL